MPQLIPNTPPGTNPVRLVVEAGKSIADLVHFQLIRLREGEEALVTVPGYELLAVVLSGSADIGVGESLFESVGQRPDIWSGQADSVYAGTGLTLRITGRAATSEIAVAGGQVRRQPSAVPHTPE